MTTYVEVHGAPVDAKEVSWVEVAPCGCVCGVAMADSSFGKFVDDAPRTTPAAAAAHFAPNAQRLKYDLECGFTHRAELRNEAVRLLLIGCTHDPKWGDAPLPTVEGHAWATTDSNGLGRRTYRQHLIPTGYLEPEGHGNRTPWDELFKRADVKTLCGKKYTGDKQWSGDFHDRSETIPCTKCVKAATPLTPTPATGDTLIGV